jgi:chloramphenicol-sensitive protein RarD
VIAHRVLWSVPVAGAVLLLRGRMGEVWDALRSPRLLAMAALTAALISLNWGVYVWAIANDRAVEAALGYYINPLFSVALGADGAARAAERPAMDRRGAWRWRRCWC